MLIPAKKTNKVVDEKAVEKFINERTTKAPAKATGSDMATVTFKVDREFLARIDKAAKAMSVPRSSFIKSALSSVLEHGVNITVS